MATEVRVSSELLEREGELAQIEAALAATSGGTGVLVLLEGPAGIGKTALIAAARRAASAGGVRVLSARGSELEGRFAWGVARQLLEPAIAAIEGPVRDRLLAGAARPAAALLSGGALPAAGEDASPDQAFATLHALYWTIANLAAEEPLLIAVDDAHWVDAESLLLLAFLAARIDDLPVALLVATRPAEGAAAEDPLARLAADPATHLVRPGSLSQGAVAAIVGERLGKTPDAAFAEAVRLVTGGVPFLVREVARELEDADANPVAAEVDRVAGLRPKTIARAIVSRLSRLDASALPVARAVAVLGADAELRRVATLAGVELEQAESTVDALAEVGILAGDRLPDFVHAIVRVALESETPASERGRLHRQAAELLADEGAAADHIAAHLQPTTPRGDPWVVDVLLEAGRQAFERGAPRAAIELLERALAEPPDAAARPLVLYELGRAEAADGRATGFRRHLREALGAAPEPDLRARIALDLGRGLATAGEFGPSVAMFAEALDQEPAPAPALAVRVEAELMAISANHYPSIELTYPQFERCALKVLAGEDVEHPILLAPTAVGLVANAPPAAHGADVAERVVREGWLANERSSPLVACVGYGFLFAGRLRRAGELYDEMIAEARRRGDRISLGWLPFLRSRVSLQQGRIAAAEAEAREALERYLEINSGPDAATYHCWGTAHLLDALVELGRLDEAGELAERWASLEFSEPTYQRSIWLGARGRLRAARGEWQAALDDVLASKIPYPSPAANPWRIEAVPLLVALDEHAEARRLAESALALARKFEVPGSIGAALRARATVEDDSAGVRTLEEAVAVLEPSEDRLEYARVLVDLGAAVRRTGRRAEARDVLRNAFDVAARCGAVVLAERARSELSRAGGRPRRAVMSGPDSLTPSERRVTTLAAEGLTNREIAQTLWVTPRTVEGHLTQAFRKLEVTSRQQLAAALEGSSAAGGES